MKKKETKPKKKQPYVEPKVIATYEKEDLEDSIKSQGSFSVSIPPSDPT